MDLRANFALLGFDPPLERIAALSGRRK